MADIRDSALFADATRPIVSVRCRQLDRCSSQASIVMQPAVPLWKVIADFGRRELHPGPQGPGFFCRRGRRLKFQKAAPNGDISIPCSRRPRANPRGVGGKKNKKKK